MQEEQEEVQELRAAHAETIQELQKTRSLLSMENSICRDYKVTLIYPGLQVLTPAASVLLVVEMLIL